MSKYSGMPCAYCTHKFEDADDVVVCPICGAPHHRACYREQGHCAIAEQHAAGFVWQAPIDASVHGTETVVCKSCNAVNPKEIGFCQMCGTRLEGESRHSEQQQSEQATAAFAQSQGRVGHPMPDAQWEVMGITAREISAYVGNGSFYFLRQFQMLLGTKLNISWNWGAFFFKFAYFFYRKMYAAGFVMLIASAVFAVPSTIYSIEFIKANSMEILGVEMAYDPAIIKEIGDLAPLINAGSFILSVTCGIFANKIYLQKVLDDIKALRTTTGGSAGGQEYYSLLYTRGKPNRLAVFGLAVLYFLIYSYIGSYLATLAGLI